MPIALGDAVRLQGTRKHYLGRAIAFQAAIELFLK